MIDLMAYNDPVYINIHLDNNNKPISLKITGEKQKVYNGIVVLNEIPDEYYKVIIDGMYETKEITDQYGYKVDYTRGQIHFHPSISDGTNITINEYYGKGHSLIPTDRIYTSLKGDGNPETMDEFLSSVDPFVYLNLWNNTTNYKKNNQVYYDGNTYICLEDCRGVIPTDNSKWRVFAGGFKWRGEYSSTENYYERDIVRVGDRQWYMCLNNCVGILPTNTEYWDNILNLAKVDDDYQAIVDDIENGMNALNEIKNQYETNLKPDAENAIMNANDKANSANVATENCNTAINRYEYIYSQSVQSPQNPVDSYDDILTTYPNPENGWVVKTLNDNKTYRYDSEKGMWVWIDTVSVDSHTHPNKSILDKINEVDGVLQYDGKDIIDHTHDNKDVLDKFTVVDGELLFDGVGIEVETANSSTEIYDWGTELGDRFMTISESEYDSLVEKDENTIYIVICDDGEGE